MTVEIWGLIPKEIRNQIEIKSIEPTDYDYSSNTTWQKLKKESDEAFKKLKHLEYNIRHESHD